MPSRIILHRGSPSRARRPHSTFASISAELKASGQTANLKYEDSASGKGKAFNVPTKLDVVPDHVAIDFRLLNVALKFMEQKIARGYSYRRMLELVAGAPREEGAGEGEEGSGEGSEGDSESEGEEDEAQVEGGGPGNREPDIDENNEDTGEVGVEAAVDRREATHPGNTTTMPHTLSGILNTVNGEEAAEAAVTEARDKDTNISAVKNEADEPAPAPEEQNTEINQTREFDETMGSAESMSLIDTDGCITEQPTIAVSGKPRITDALEANSTLVNIDQGATRQVAEPSAKTAKHNFASNIARNTGNHMAMASFEISHAFEKAKMTIESGIAEVNTPLSNVNTRTGTTTPFYDALSEVEESAKKPSIKKPLIMQANQAVSYDQFEADIAATLSSGKRKRQVTKAAEDQVDPGDEVEETSPRIQYPFLAHSLSLTFQQAYLAPSRCLHHTILPQDPTPASNLPISPFDRDCTKYPEPEPTPFDYEDLTHHLQHFRLATSGFTDTWRMSPMGTSSWLTVEGDTARSATFLNYASDLICAHIIVYVVRPFDIPDWKENSLGLSLLSEFLQKGAAWSPEEKYIEEFDLVRGDTLILPSFSIFKVEYVSQALISTGICMRKENLREHFLAWRWDVLGRTTRCFMQSREVLEFLREVVLMDPEMCGFRSEEMCRFEEDCVAIWSGLRLSEDVFLEEVEGSG